MEVAVGDTWQKLDLHIHTPYSLETSYGNKEDESTWEKFVEELEAVCDRPTIIGINDYWSIEGYRRILEYKNKGRLKNASMIVPIVEMRLEEGTSAKGVPNFHIAFDPQIPTEKIEKYFIEQLKCSYQSADGERTYSYNTEELTEFGRSLIDAGLQGKPLNLGKKQFKVKTSEIKKILDHQELRGKFLRFLGGAEWKDLNNGKQLLPKLAQINSADGVFIASQNSEEFEKTKEKVSEFNDSIAVIHGSDAHRFDDGVEGTRYLGAGRTWIRTDNSFAGLKFALRKYEERLTYCAPKEFSNKETTGTANVLKELTVSGPEGKVEFDYGFQINPGYIAIIGNKGQGKSALVDWMAMSGGARVADDHYSFLNNNRFSYKRNKKYEATSEWLNNNPLRVGYDGQNGLSTSRVDYFPQKYLEELCSADPTSENGKELRALIEGILYRALPGEVRASYGTLQEYLSSLAGADTSERDIATNIRKLSSEIASLDSRIRRLKAYDLQNRKIRISANISALATEVAALDSESGGLTQLSERLLEADHAREVMATTAERVAANGREFERMAIEFKEIVADRVAALGDSFDPFPGHSGPWGVFGGEEGMYPGLYKTILSVSEALADKIDELLLLNSSLGSSAIMEMGDIVDSARRAAEDYTDRISKSPDSDLDQKKSALGRLRGGVTDPDQDVWSLDGVKRLIKELESDEAEIQQKKREIDNLSRQLLFSYSSRAQKFQDILSGVEAVRRVSESDVNVVSQLTVPSFDEILSSGINRQRYRDGFEDLSDLLAVIAREGASDANSIDEFFEVSWKLIERISQLDSSGSSCFKADKDMPWLISELFLFGGTSPSIGLGLDGEILEDLSPGQRGLVLLLFVLIVDNSSNVLILDQPEDNLDNATIRNYLLPAMDEARSRRQIISVTHNANVGVLGDPDQVLICRHDDSCFMVSGGSLSSELVRIDVIELLEGAEEAFKLRSERYGFAVSI